MESIYRFLSEKVDKGAVPLKPFEIVEWAQSEFSRPPTATVLLEKANSIKQTIDHVDALLIHVPTSALVMDQIFSQQIAKASVTGLRLQGGRTHFSNKTKLPHVEFEDGKGGDEGSYFIDFSLSSDQTGIGWAVDHLAGAREESVIPRRSTSVENTLGQRRGETAFDPMTYMNSNPFEGGRRPPGSGN